MLDFEGADITLKKNLKIKIRKTFDLPVIVESIRIAHLL
jgi:hypothetical protein